MGSATCTCPQLPFEVERKFDVVEPPITCDQCGLPILVNMDPVTYAPKGEMGVVYG